MRRLSVQPEARGNAQHSPEQAIHPRAQTHGHSRITHPWRHSLPLVGITVLVVLAGILALGPVHHAFAAGLSFNTCANASFDQKAAFCTGADPIVGGCAQDAITPNNERPIVFAGTRVGLAQVRYSPSCNAYWGRGFSFVPGAILTIHLPALGTGDAGSFQSQSSSIYSNMFYDPIKGDVPTVIVGVILSPTQVAQVTIKGIG